MSYEVRTRVFEGPLELLLHLVATHDVDLYELSLAELVDAFVAEMGAMGPLDLDLATEFLVAAATLVDLKTRRLLPAPEPDDLDEELAPFEERDLLLARLLEARTFQAAGAALERLARTAGRSRPRTVGLEPPFLDLAPDLLAGVTPADLAAAYARAGRPRPSPRVDIDHVAPIRASVRDAVEELVGSLPGAGPVSFRRLTSGLPRLEVIVRFLAVLELYKEGLVDLDQAATFGDLTVAWVGPADGLPSPSALAAGEDG